MKKFITLSLIFIASYSATAQRFEVDTIQKNGSTDKLINIVILGDGYTQNQLSQFANDARNTTTTFFSEAPLSYYKNYFNIFAIKVSSNVSGAANSPYQLIDNYFGSTFNYDGIERLLVPTRTSKIMNVLASTLPEYDQIVMIVNDMRYGGSGNSSIGLATFSLHEFSMAIFIHEFGHSFANLADEYWAGAQYARERINMTQNTNLATLKWKNWYGDFDIGLYPHSESPTWYRPHQNCKMRYMGVSFCAVCTEGIIEKIHSLVSPLQSHSPTSENITDYSYPLSFNLALLKPTPNTLRVEWKLNNSTINLNSDELTLNAADLAQGVNKLSVSIEDTTELLRVNNHSFIHLSAVSWSVEKLTIIDTIPRDTIITGVKNISSKEVNINIFPNPFHDYLTIKFKQSLTENLKVEIIDIMGRIQMTQVFSPQESYSLNVSSLHNGYYIINLYLDNALIASSKIVKE